MLQVVTTGAYYPPVVTAGRFLLQEHPSRQRGHCAKTASVAVKSGSLGVGWF